MDRKARRPPADRTRREFVRTSAAVGAAVVAAGCAAGAGGRLSQSQDEDHETAAAEEVSPGEDLMREHGVLKRVLLVYREGIRRLEAREQLPADTVADAARIIRGFIEDYHEKLEEEFLFPRFRRAHVHLELIDVLTAQHQAGRRLTDRTIELTTPTAIPSPADRRGLVAALRAFVRMYEPHEAREDTVLFPALRNVVAPRDYDALGEQFEEKEHELFGEDGFGQMVERVAGIEKTLGIYDLAQFTPPLR